MTRPDLPRSTVTAAISLPQLSQTPLSPHREREYHDIDDNALLGLKITLIQADDARLALSARG